MLHITNGDSAARQIVAACVVGQVLAWKDGLHEGPVPATVDRAEFRRVRASFIASQGWEDAEPVLSTFERRDAAVAESDAGDEIVLWFEHDLYDQLQLLDVLDCITARADRPMISLAQSDCYLGTLSTSELRALYAKRQKVGAAELQQAAAVWKAFRATDPRQLERLTLKTSAFPFLPSALRRHLEQYPADGDGVSRSERQILTAVAAGRATLGRAFDHHNALEEAVFLGDVVFVGYVARMLEHPVALLRLMSREPLGRPSDFDDHAAFWDRTLMLTEAGASVLRGGRDWVAEQGIDRWYGGVHLTGRTPRWRWRRDKQKIVEARRR
jgi:hypothetical protein